MVILIDSGNSRIKLGLMTAQRGEPDAAVNRAWVTPIQPLTTSAFANEDLAGVRQWLAVHLAQSDVVRAEAVDSDIPGIPTRAKPAWGVNVAGSAQQAALDAVFGEFGYTIAWHKASARQGRLINGYTLPTQLGADRWASLLGVMGRTPRVHPPILLASFGTATTIDLIGPDDVFEGGVILPGPLMMARALAYGTANLPLAQGTSALFPKDTSGAIATGISSAQAGAVLRQYLLAHAQYKVAPTVYVAGGAWEGVETETRRLLDQTSLSLLGRPAHIETLQHPVLDGLALIAGDLLAEKGTGQ